MTWWESLNWLSRGMPWQVAVGIFAASGVLLFFSVPLGIYEWAHLYRGLEITAFAFSAAILLANITSWVGPSIVSQARQVAVRRRGRKYLHNLNPEEKKYCKHFVDSNGSPLPHNPATGAIASLVVNGILWQPKQGWDWMYEFNIQPWALDYLKKHPELLQGASERP